MCDNQGSAPDPGIVRFGPMAWRGDPCPVTRDPGHGSPVTRAQHADHAAGEKRKMPAAKRRNPDQSVKGNTKIADAKIQSLTPSAPPLSTPCRSRLFPRLRGCYFAHAFRHSLYPCLHIRCVPAAAGVLLKVGVDLD